MSHRQLPAAVRLGLVLAFAIGWILHPHIQKEILISWLFCIVVVSMTRIISLRHIASDDFNEAQANQYSIRYTVTAFLLGTTWASVAFLVPYVGTEERILIFVLLISIAGGALTTTASHVISFYFYSYPILIAYAANVFLLGERVWVLLGVLTMVYAIYMTIAAWKLSSSLKESITLRYRWQETADTLEKTREDLNRELDNRTVAENKLKSVMSELEQAVSHLEQLAAFDELTGIPNRRSFDAAIAREWNRARREQSSIALLMIDVDYFKNFNDLYLHQQGDDALKQVARVLQQHTQRPGDTAARYGGEEFALILVNPTADYVKKTAETLRQDILDLRIKHDRSEVSDYLTVSIGTAMSNAPGNDDYSVLIRSADGALYEAKQAGRNQVIAA
ncbi:MAG: diguanylate cyclase [Gammaproteobacteria bacterium]|nr:diguanylate cyclase [Gammaproteobacteria bacterium]